MSEHGQRDGFEERVEEGSDIAFSMLGGNYIDPKTGRFKPGHERRVEVARQALISLAIPPQEIEDSIALGEVCAREHVRQLQQIELRDQLGFGSN